MKKCKELTFEEYIEKYNFYRTILTIKNFDININSKEVDSIIQKELVKMYPPGYRIVFKPKQSIKISFRNLLQQKDNILDPFHPNPISIENLNNIVSKLGFITEINKVVSIWTLPLIIVINDSEELCSQCKGSGIRCIWYGLYHSIWRECGTCKGLKKLTWIDKVKRNPRTLCKKQIITCRNVDGENIITSRKYLK